MIGKRGRYDDLAQLVRREARAGVVIVLVLDGKHGHGFSVCQRRDGVTEPVHGAKLAEFLRMMAEEIELDPTPSGFSSHVESDGSKPD